MDKLRAVHLAGGAGGAVHLAGGAGGGVLGMANRVYPHQARYRHPHIDTCRHMSPHMHTPLVHT